MLYQLSQAIVFSGDTMKPRQHTITPDIVRSVVDAVRGGAHQRDAFVAAGIPVSVGARWIWEGTQPDPDPLKAELASGIRAARAVPDPDDDGALVLGLMPDGERRTGIELLAARVPAAAAALTGDFDPARVAQRAVQIQHALAEIHADMVARLHELRPANLRALERVSANLSKASEQLASAEEARAGAAAARTVEMTVVAFVAVAARIMTADQLMLFRSELERLPAVSGVFGDDPIIDVTPAPPPEEPAEITEPDGLSTEEVSP